MPPQKSLRTSPVTTPTTSPEKFEQPAKVEEPALVHGESLEEAVFLQRRVPDGYSRAELVNGVVELEMTGRTHGEAEDLFVKWINKYIELEKVPYRKYANTYFKLGPRTIRSPDIQICEVSEPQDPKAASSEPVRVVPRLIVEVAITSGDRDKGTKKAEYLAAGVLEYIIFHHEADKKKPAEIHYFRKKGKIYEEVRLSSDGCYHSEAFLGLLLHKQHAVNYRDVDVVNALPVVKREAADKALMQKENRESKLKVVELSQKVDKSAEKLQKAEQKAEQKKKEAEKAVRRAEQKTKDVEKALLEKRKAEEKAEQKKKEAEKALLEKRKAEEKAEQKAKEVELMKQKADDAMAGKRKIEEELKEMRAKLERMEKRSCVR